MSLKKIARGPITMAKALNDDPVTYPGPDERTAGRRMSASLRRATLGTGAPSA